jgi:glycyl-tRNA synthetase
MAYSDVFQKVVSHCKEHGFIFPSSDIYDGLGAVYDYGPLGVLLKKNIQSLWWKSMVQLRDDIVGLDSAILMHPTVWKASGHVDAFSDPLIDNKDSKKRFRADVLIEEYIQKRLTSAQKDSEKKAKKENWTLGDEAYTHYLKQHRDTKKAEEVQARFVQALEADNLPELKAIIEDCEIADPDSGSRNWTDVRQFNLMFKTQLGALVGDTADLYLRPETAQGIFVNFLNVQKTMRMKPPFGIAQIGKAFRNEIVAKQFIFRMREFEQMEMQFFIAPGTQQEWFAHWRDRRMAWHRSLGITPERLRFKPHHKLAHYADAATDIEFEFPFGFKELEGIHSRTDFDLRRHQEFSGKKLQYFDPETRESYTPYVVETSVGLDRTFLTHLCDAYAEEEVGSADSEGAIRTVLRLHPLLAPTTVAVFPLVKKDSMPEIAEKLAADLRFDYNVQLDEKDTIGRRYRRMDAKGTPFCITIDQDTLEQELVTIRHRDSMQQEQMPLTAVRAWLADQLDIRKLGW